MSRIFKVLIAVFLIILILSVGIFLYFFNHIVNVDSDIKNSAEIHNLNNKKLFSIYPESDIKKVTTDFYLDEEQKNDTVFYNCRFEETGILNAKRISFISGDGFSGLKINVTKFGPFFRTDIENYTDDLSNNNLPKYDVKEQSLTLDKSDYKKGDSIYGSIKIKVIREIEKNKQEYQSIGYFRTTL